MAVVLIAVELHYWFSIEVVMGVVVVAMTENE